MIHSKRSQEGYLIIDHRASPGVKPEDLANVPAHRRHEFIVPHGPVFEVPTMRCSHCGTMVILNPNRIRPRNYCGKCDHYICDNNPACLMGCIPFEQTIDKALEEAALLINVREV